MANNLSYSKYILTKTVTKTAWCERCQQDTESDVLVPENHDLPLFIICWNCHDVRQSGVGRVERQAVEHIVAADLPTECPHGHGDLIIDHDHVYCDFCSFSASR